MMVSMTKARLTSARKQLIELMQTLNFGRIEALRIREGEPVLEPTPRRIREVRFPGENGPRPEVTINNFLLKAQVIELFRLFDEFRDGTIELLEIKHGLPFKILVA